MLFRLLSSLIKLVTRQFFRRISVCGAPIVLDRPVVFAANHPNQAVDSFVLGTVVNREIFFLAKSTLFSNPMMARFLTSMHMLPIYRRMDSADVSKNQATFAVVCQKLQTGAAVLIFPEGTSIERRVLLPLKTGAARIALQAAQQSAHHTGRAFDICIQPVSITYENPYLFQSSVTVTVAEPIEVANYLEQYQHDAVQAVDQLTAELEQALRAITVHIEKERHQPIIEQISCLFSESSNDQQLYARVTKAVEALIDRQDPEISRLLASLQNLQPQRFNRQIAASRQVRTSLLKTVLQAPLVLIGAVMNFIPYQLVGLFTVATVADRHNLASVKIFSSIIFYPLWYLSLYIVVVLKFGVVAAVTVLIVTLASAWCANRWWDEVAVVLRRLIVPSQTKLQAQLEQLRVELLKIEQRESCQHPA